MKSSYKNSLDYSDLLKTITFLKKPKKIVEFGILDGFSLDAFAESSPLGCSITAYDIFEKFNGNSAKRNIIDNFKKFKNVNILEGDFYKVFKDVEDNSIDILHIDIANDGDVYNFAIKNYLSKVKTDGIIILEGGSIERDNVEWMIKYNKKPIFPVVEKLKEKYDIYIINKFPSITIINVKDK